MTCVRHQDALLLFDVVHAVAYERCNLGVLAAIWPWEGIISDHWTALD